MSEAITRHPRRESLRSYGTGAMTGEEAADVGRHLESCSDCRRLADEFSVAGLLRRAYAGPNGLGGGGAQRGIPSIDLPPGFDEEGDYEILKELGRGGMGVVFLAHNRLMGRDEVLKVIGREVADAAGAFDRFTREIRAVARLRHRNIVTAYYAVRKGERLVFAMEYVDGLDLARLVKVRGPLPTAHACAFANQAAQGLQHAFEAGVVHRDIKPGNLILAGEGDQATVKVLDFGLAKASSERKADGALTLEGQALGTPNYIAPEQIRDASSADIRADVYSLGGTLYHMLAGRPPFEAGSVYHLYQAHLTLEAEPLHRIRPDVPEELSAVVAKMLAKDPSQRFQTPGEAARALKPFFKKSKGADRPADASSPQRPVAGAEWSTLIDFQGAPDVAAAEPPRAASRNLRSAAAGFLLATSVFAAAWLWGGGMGRGQAPTPLPDRRPEVLGAEFDLANKRVEVQWPADRAPEMPQPEAPADEGAMRPDRAEQADAVAAKDETAPTAIPPAPPVVTPAREIEGDWSVEGGELVQNARPRGRDATILFGDPGWSDYNLSFEAKSTGGTHGFKALYHWTDRGNYYTFALGNYYNKWADLSYNLDRKWARDKGLCKPGGIEFDRWYAVRLRVRGPEVTCYVDGSETFRHRDERFTRGRIGFATWDATARFANIVVTTPEGRPLWSGCPRDGSATPEP